MNSKDYKAGLRGQGLRLNKKQRAETQEKFLAAFASSGIVGVACRAASCGRTAVLVWQEHDEEFANRYRQARLEAHDQVRAEIVRRGVLGVDKPVFYNGNQIATVKEYSDRLLELYAKSLMPEFREKQQIEHSGTISVLDLIGKAVEVGSDS